MSFDPWMASFARESLTIAGWVAMWRPMQIFLYDWWPLRRLGKIYESLSRLPVELRLRRADPHPQAKNEESSLRSVMYSRH